MNADKGAIQTTWNGKRYRSRLECRWAMFFDRMGIQYEYEPEGYNLGTIGCYLPDFRLAQVSPLGTPSVFVEIKPESPTDTELEKCYLLAQLTERDVFIFIGPPGHKGVADVGCDAEDIAAAFDYRVIPFLQTANWRYGPGDSVYCGSWWYPWSECPECGTTGIVMLAEKLACGGCEKYGHSMVTTYDAPRLYAAYEYASGFRFDGN